jgi:hypothetical protein
LLLEDGRDAAAAAAAADGNRDSRRLAKTKDRRATMGKARVTEASSVVSAMRIPHVMLLLLVIIVAKLLVNRRSEYACRGTSRYRSRYSRRMKAIVFANRFDFDIDGKRMLPSCNVVHREAHQRRATSQGPTVPRLHLEGRELRRRPYRYYLFRTQESPETRPRSPGLAWLRL